MDVVRTSTSQIIKENSSLNNKSLVPIIFEQRTHIFSHFCNQGVNSKQIAKNEGEEENPKQGKLTKPLGSSDHRTNNLYSKHNSLSCVPKLTEPFRTVDFWTDIFMESPQSGNFQ